MSSWFDHSDVGRFGVFVGMALHPVWLTMRPDCVGCDDHEHSSITFTIPCFPLVLDQGQRTFQSFGRLGLAAAFEPHQAEGAETTLTDTLPPGDALKVRVMRYEDGIIRLGHSRD